MYMYISLSILYTYIYIYIYTYKQFCCSRPRSRTWRGRLSGAPTDA